MKTFYVTTAIDYVNAEPHIGHAYQKIAADVLARWHRSEGKKVFFLTGTDEHGLKIARSAEKEGLKPKEFCDRLAVKFRNAWDKLNLKYDRFIRTTDKDHERIVKKFIKKIAEKGDIYKGVYEGLYCVECEAYITEKDLVNGTCPFHLGKKIESLKEETYFFKLSKYQEKILQHIEKHPEFVLPESRRNEIINRLREGLKDLSITRTSFSWGIPFPLEKGHFTYVWFEALLNYITALGWPSGAKFRKFWPANTHLLGKDNAWFHCVIWPAMLFSAGIEIPKTVYVHGFITSSGQKISKSLGNVVSPVYLSEKYGSDAVKYAILKENNFAEDGDFSERNLIARLNSDLADSLGNLLSRTLTLIEKFSGGKILRGKIDAHLKKEFEKTLKETEEFMGKYEFHHALEKIWSFINLANKYINDSKPWELAKEDSPQAQFKLKNVLFNSAECLRLISALAFPFIPNASEEISRQLGVPVPNLKKIKFGKIPEAKVRKGKILFQKIENSPTNPTIRTHPTRPTRPTIPDLRVAEVLEASDMPGSDKLYKMKISLGKLGERQIIAGMKPYYSKEELLGKKIIVVANLKPAKIKGEDSNGMLLAVEKGEEVELLEAGRSDAGDEVKTENWQKSAAEITIEDFSKIKIEVRDFGVFCGGKPLKTKKEEIRTRRMRKGIVR